MNNKGPMITIFFLLTLALSPFLAAAEWTDIHQIQSSSHSVTMTGDGYYMDPSNAYDGIGSQSGDPVILRTQTCFITSTPSAGTTIEIDYILATNQSSNPFNLIFNLVFIADVDAPDAYASVSVYNENSLTYIEIVNATSSGGVDYNISRSSAYMDDAGNVLLKLKSGHSVEDCAASTETRVYEFEIYADSQQQTNTDADSDGIEDGDDSCPNGNSGWASNPATDYDNDGCQDSLEDEDDDNDGLIDLDDSCPKGDFFTSLPGADYDGDGCKDDSEDNDDDGDSIIDFDDLCPVGKLNWSSINSNDYDSDGCNDIDEDNDDDNDNVSDIIDSCSKGNNGWTSTIQLDFDNDGCLDAVEDNDDDNDLINDSNDMCPKGDLSWQSTFEIDHDQDGCKDSTEDSDDDNDLAQDAYDSCPYGLINWNRTTNDHDDDGCHDEIEDSNDDNDALLDLNDACPRGYIPSITNLEQDWDGDGCFDFEDDNDDNDNFDDYYDGCPKGAISFSGEDWDNDGCQDSTEDDDDDNDGIVDENDRCAKGLLNWSSTPNLDFDSDGCHDVSEDDDDDDDLIADTTDECQLGHQGWQSNSASDYDRDGCADDFEDLDDDNDNVSDGLDKCPTGVLNWESNPEEDWDGDGCFDSYEDPDDDNDLVNDTSDQCPQTVIFPVDENTGCTFVKSEVSDGESNANYSQVAIIGGLSLVIILLGGLFLGGSFGYLWRALEDEIDPTSEELIDKLKVIQGNTDGHELLVNKNVRYLELIQQMQQHLEIHEKKYPEIIVSAGFNVLEKMESKTFTHIGAALFFRAILTCLARIHLNRLNSNGYRKDLKNGRDGRKPSGHDIIQHYCDKPKKLKRWLVSLDEDFEHLNQRVRFWSEVVHVEDPNAPNYGIPELEDDCESLVSYSRALITHPPWSSTLEHQ